MVFVHCLIYFDLLLSIQDLNECDSNVCVSVSGTLNWDMQETRNHSSSFRHVSVCSSVLVSVGGSAHLFFTSVVCYVDDCRVFWTSVVC